MLAVVCAALVLTGCEKEKATTISVEVVKSGEVQPNVQVYMYSGLLGDSFLQSKIHAYQNVATDENGVAEFTLPSTFFGAGSDKATAVFQTFDEKGTVTGKVPASVNKGENKKVTLKMN